jgi:hypothetical protein
MMPTESGVTMTEKWTHARKHASTHTNILVPLNNKPTGMTSVFLIYFIYL